MNGTNCIGYDRTNNILSLSGGSQQKALFARAHASDAAIVLMDYPMRGADFSTKLEVYALIGEEVRAGRTFLGYSTEADELQNCDHVYVFRDGLIVADLNGAILIIVLAARVLISQRGTER